ncbi:unnamed protein product [Cuscuta campestris]|uniref:Retrotransposon gag domain-containing protein n=1 Tax=Cuscuta campestris TaxID=132261 RepID=A0A484L6Q3_9ASTE|nr:unnamed protein product [Cuscuta campestris]
MSLGLTHIPTPSMATPFTVPIPSAGPRVTFPPSMTQFMNDPANLQAIQGFGQVMAMCKQNGGMPFLHGMFPFALPGAGTMPLQTPMTDPQKEERKNHPANNFLNSAFERLGNKEEGQRKSAKLRLGQSVAHQMEAKLERLENKVGEKNDRDKPLAGSPFTSRVHLTPFPQKVKIDALTGKEDPEIHLDSFNQRSIDSVNDLSSKFKAKFQENCTKRKKLTYLSTPGQRESENLTQSLTRWTEELDKVEEMDDKIVLSLLLNGLRAGELYKEFFRMPPVTYQEAYHTAWEFAKAETHLRAKKEAEHRFKPKLVQIKKEEAPGPIRPRHHYDSVIRVVNTKECQ